MQLETHYEAQEKENLRKMAYRDYLTGLYNRNYISKWKEEVLENDQYPVSMIMIDCNNLKKTNDTYGHEEGDRLLKTVAEHLQAHFNERQYLILRMGGDEFMVICPKTFRGECIQKMQQITEELKECKICNIPISFCYGVGTMEQQNYDLLRCSFVL